MSAKTLTNRLFLASNVNVQTKLSSRMRTCRQCCREQYSPMGLSLASDVNLQMRLSSMLDHILNWERHCSTATPDVARHRHRFLTVQAAVTPTSVLPAPVGSTLTFTTRRQHGQAVEALIMSGSRCLPAPVGTTLTFTKWRWHGQAVEALIMLKS